MKKTERLSRLLNLLNNSQKIRISDIAAACKTSERTVYRDLKTLSSSGNTIISEDGYAIGSHVSLPVSGQFNELELRLIRFALETHQLGAVFPFSDLAARLTGATAQSGSQMNQISEVEYSLTKAENEIHLPDKTGGKSRWPANADTEAESKE